MRTLVLNAGSRTLKASLVQDGTAIARAEVDGTGDGLGPLVAMLAGEGPLSSVGPLGDDGPLGGEGSLTAVAHRIVHGGDRFTAPVVVDAGVLATLRDLVALAPLHMPPALAVLDAALQRFPDVPQVCCFDTAFHATLPESEVRYPVPEAWRTDWGIRRFGFHGLSVEWSVRRAAELLGRPVGELRMVVAHLGGGCSVTAVSGGRSVRTSMGYTPLEGLMMLTRPGSIDPGIVLRLLGDGRLTVAQLSDALEHQSGLLGVSGVSADVRQVTAAANAGDARAILALEMFASRAAAGIAAAATALTGLDALVFTGGIGEHAGALRAAIVARLGVLGVAPIEDDESGADRVLGPTDRTAVELTPAVLRVTAREDLVMAEAAASLVGRAR